MNISMSIVILGKNNDNLNKYSSKWKREVLGSEVGSCNIIYGGDHRWPNKQANLNIDLKKVGNEPGSYPREEQ